MPFRTVRTERKTPTGIVHTTRREWYDIPKRHTVAGMLGNDSIAKAVANEPITYEYQGRLYEDTPASMIDRIDEVLWAGNVAFKDRALALVQRAKQKAEAMRAENNNTLQGGNNTMKHNNFRSIFTELKSIYADSHAVCKKLFAEFEEAEKEWNNVRTSVSTDPRTKLLAESDFIRAEDKFKKAHEEITRTTQQRVADLRKTLEEAVKTHYRVKPDKVDNATLELLRLGVLKDSDLEQIAQDNIGNPTMLAVIQKYAGERKESPEMRYLALSIRDILDSDKEINTFDTLCEYGARSYGKDSIKRNAFDQFFDEMFDNAIANTSDRAFDTMSVADRGEGTGEGE